MTLTTEETAAAAAPKAPGDGILVLANYYFVELLTAPAETERGIALPELAVTDVFDGIVLAHGPGRILSGGGRYPMQATVGDRIVVRPWHFHLFETETIDGRPVKRGFMTDEDLVAVKRFGPDGWGPLEPCGDYTLLDPDPVESVKMSAGGIAIATAILGGGDLRERQRGEELHRELLQLEQSSKWLEQPDEYYRHRVVWDFLESLSRWELEALQATIDRGGDSGWKGLRKITLREQPTSGRVVVPGPGPVREDEVGAYRSHSSLIDPAHLGRTAKYLCQLAPGDRVHWNRQFSGVFLSDEEGTFLAVPARYLDAFEAEDEPETAG